jgi:hypothetical protein
MKATVRVQARPGLPILRSLAMVMMYSLFSHLSGAIVDWWDAETAASARAYAEEGLPPPPPPSMIDTAIVVIGRPVLQLAGGILGIIVMGAASEDREIIAGGIRRIFLLSVVITIIVTGTPRDWNLISWLPPALIAVYHRHCTWRADLFLLNAVDDNTAASTPKAAVSATEASVPTQLSPSSTVTPSVTLTKSQKKAATVAAATTNTSAALKERSDAMKSKSSVSTSATPSISSSSPVRSVTKKYRKRGHWCARALRLAFVWFLFSSLCMNYIVNRWSITTDVGDVKIKEAISRMRRSKAYQDLWAHLEREWNNAKQVIAHITCRTPFINHYHYCFTRGYCGDDRGGHD